MVLVTDGVCGICGKDIVSYLQFVTGEKVSTSESQRNEVHVDKVRDKGAIDRHMGV